MATVNAVHGLVSPGQTLVAELVRPESFKLQYEQVDILSQIQESKGSSDWLALNQGNRRQIH